jgi:hypothetical protein
MNPNDMSALIAVVVTLGFVVCIIVLSWVKVKTRGGATSPELAAIASRLERMEASIDAMAVETERISEAQRFAAKLLSERVAEPHPRA